MNKLTVILCTYNRAEYISDAIKGILEQTYKDFDFFIYDNASTDNTKDVVESFLDVRIQYIYFDENVGMEGNWLRAVKNCKTEYLSIAHDDDIMSPTLLEREIKIFEEDSEILIVSCRSQFINEKNEVLEGKYNTPFTEDKEMQKYEYFEMAAEYNGAFFMSAPAAMFRISAIKDMDYSFFKPCGSVSDTYWYLKTNELGKIYLIGDALLMYRKHGGQYSHNHLKAVKEHRDYILPLLKTHLNEEQILKIKTAYENEIRITEFSLELTNEFEEQYTGYYASEQTFIDRDLFARIKFLNNIARGKKKSYVIWGAGSAGIKNKQVFDVLLPNYELRAFIDKFKTGDIEGIPIFAPDEFVFDKSDYVVIATSTGGFDVMGFLEGKGLKLREDFMVGNITA